MTSRVGGALRSSTLFWVRRRRASSSPRVTLWIPPLSSDRVGLSIRLSRLLPWAVPISWKPRSAIVRAAWASSSVPISSMTMTWGMWFSTASIITSCCSDGVRTCIRRALPMAGWGMSPSPAISFEVSTTTTRLPCSSARTRAASRSIVVLPMPGRPMIRIDFPVSTKSLMISIVPYTARPIRHVSPTIFPFRFRIALIRCRVRSIPARLSSPNDPMCSTTWAMSDSVISRSRSMTSESGKRASGRRHRSRTTSISASFSGSAWTASTISFGSEARSASRSLIDSRRRSAVNRASLGSTDARRHERRLRDTHQRVLHEQRHRRDRTEARVLEPSIDRRLVRPDRGDDAVLATRAAVLLRPGADDPERVLGEGGRVDLGPGQQLQVVGLVLLGDADLGKAVKLGAVLAAGRALLDEGLDVGEPEDRRETAARHPPARALALPVGQPQALEALDGLRRRRRVQARKGQRVQRHRRSDPAVAGLLVGPGRGQVLVAVAMEDPLVAIAGEARLHEQLDVAALVGAGDMEPPRTALRGLAEDLVDEPEADVACLPGADPVELDDRPLVADRVALHPDQARQAALLLVDVHQVVRLERAEREPEQAEDADRTAADGKPERARGRADVVAEPGQLAEGGEVGQAGDADL